MLWYKESTNFQIFYKSCLTPVNSYILKNKLMILYDLLVQELFLH